MKILVVEDENKLAGFIQQGLHQAGYIVQHSDNGSEALRKAASETFDLILLDLMLPGMNGIEVLKNLRAFKILSPVIIVSALSGTSQVVEGLDLGAVDYIKKPFEWEELLARIRILQRKIFTAETTRIRVEDLVIDLMTRQVVRGNQQILLTAKEFALLEYLIRNTNRVVSKNQILENVWNMSFDPESNVVEVFMYQLRKKVDKDFDKPLIETVIGVGYKLSGTKSSL
ncbi:two-component system, OmpR family, copper resistance phosphate regulon response regulator CusR [Dyadobacter koreensis]|uniref:Two-component system, OmpR family, copper resistance phosphate regulon response regulator CusR n=1 Tax=Dyadobacter koreensis TaxID=408657 RepID=A0A1H6YDP5_9BACT|nr:response regulator transcription factor [Dyadobacter koreensis]SEJ39381.1 two-component system, OmpR family, copper resistance phosphate regulon response regulator CusR [Dyadobacter koreensis]